MSVSIAIRQYSGKDGPVLTKAPPDWNTHLLPYEFHHTNSSSSVLASCTVAQKPADGVVGHGVGTAIEALRYRKVDY